MAEICGVQSKARNKTYITLTKMKTLSIATLPAALVTFPVFVRAAAPEIPDLNRERPNIIYILADDMGYGDLSCYGQRHFPTPNIDRLASEGMLFTSHYAGSALSAPSRCALMTGMHTGHGRIRANFSGDDQRVCLRAEDTTIPELLKKAGYSTAMFGKWGLGELETEGTPTRKGFDEFFGYINQKHAHFYYYPYLQHNEQQFDIPENSNGARGKYTFDLIHQKAKEYIESAAKGGRPFFACLTYTIPHSELDVPDDDLDKFAGRFDETPYPGSASKGYRPQPTPKAAFAAMITRLDRSVGEIMEMLRKLGIDRNTLVIFTSDNGPHGEGGADPLFFNSNGGLRGIKRDLYEGGIREPMIVRWPSVVEAGSRTDHVSAFWDVMPTLCEAAGAEIPAGIDGESFFPVLNGDPSPVANDRVFYWELGEKSVFKQAVRMGNYKAVRYGLTRPIEIYDLAVDRAEENDIAAWRPDLLAKAMDYFSSLRVDDPNFPMQDFQKRGKGKAFDPDDER